MNGYDLKVIAKLIFQSHTYQRQSTDLTESGLQAFVGPVRRQMSAEQLVDSLFVASGRPFDAGPINVDIDGARNYSNSLNLGVPKRAWQFASLSNERDRPSLSLPHLLSHLLLRCRHLAGRDRVRIRLINVNPHRILCSQP